VTRQSTCTAVVTSNSKEAIPDVTQEYALILLQPLCLNTDRQIAALICRSQIGK
jgi:hypothetical protein